MTLRAVARDPLAIPFAPIFASLAILSAAAASLLLAWPVGSMVICPFRALTGLPCPTCGGTHALAALARMRPIEALRLNPLVTLGALGAVAAGTGSFLRLLGGKPALQWVLTPRERLSARAALVILLALHWTYLLVRA